MTFGKKKESHKKKAKTKTKVTKSKKKEQKTEEISTIPVDDRIPPPWTSSASVQLHM